MNLPLFTPPFWTPHLYRQQKNDFVASGAKKISASEPKYKPFGGGGGIIAIAQNSA
jgi:hypothetical protein